MNFGITAALVIVTYIGAWNQFWWPFIMTTQEETITVTIVISSVQDAFVVRYAREIMLAVLAGFPITAAYLVFQKKVTNALMLTSGIKGSVLLRITQPEAMALPEQIFWPPIS